MKLGHGVEPAYFSQHEAELDERGSVLDAAVAATGLRRPEAQKLLGRFLFSGWEEHEKPVTALSGGERRRLALALVVASGANFLVLDEPTNHLDLESREALEAALERVPRHGAARHARPRAPRRGLGRACSRSRIGAARLLPGRLGRVPAAAATPTPEPAPKPAEAAEAAEARPPAPAAAPTPLELVEREIARTEERVAELERQLADDWTNVDLVAAHRAARDDLSALLARWERLFEEAAEL